MNINHGESITRVAARQAAGGGEATTMEEGHNTTDAEKETIGIMDGDQGGDVRETG